MRDEVGTECFGKGGGWGGGAFGGDGFFDSFFFLEGRGYGSSLRE